jgi:hypothetical protein
MGVGPTSIHAHFKGGTGAVLDAVAAQAVAGTTRPFKPMEEPAEYLRELFQKILESLHARPVIAGLVILRLSSDPFLDPLLAERLLLTLAALGVPKDALPNTFQRAMGVMLEMVLMVSARSKAAEQETLSARMDQAIAGSPVDRVSEPDGIARGLGRRDGQSRSLEADPRGRRALRGPGYRRARPRLTRRRPKVAWMDSGERSDITALFE